jgi:aminobenzoyl-glutamate utilization protein B
MLISVFVVSFMNTVAAQKLTPENIHSAVDQVQPIVVGAASTLWKHSELSLQELNSSAYLMKALEDNGFTITSKGTAGVPTAFIAEYGSGKPVVGIMTEYDALPGLGNEPVTKKESRKDGVSSGHGCGHNLIGAGGLGAAIALRNLMEEHKTPGTIRVYGAAAEESEGAKVYMAREGVFNDVDAMLHWHPQNIAGLWYARTAAVGMLHVEFKGKTAHAGLEPWKGRSALDAVELFTHGINLMREHVEPTARLQYIIPDGGVAPNVVPDFATVKMFYRDIDRAHVEKSMIWLKEIAKGAALATQTETLAVDYFGMHDLLPNTAMANRMQQHLETIGIPKYTDEEIAFAKEIQKSAGVEPTGMTNAIIPLPAQVPTMGGSTDVGDASWITPTMGTFMPTIPENIGVHTWMATSSHGMSIGFKGATNAAKVLTATGWDLLTDAELLEEVQAEFKERTKGFTYKSPIPDIIKEPVLLPDDMKKHESIIELKEYFKKHANEEGF